MTPNGTVKRLLSYMRRSKANYNQIVAMQSRALTSIDEGRGGQIISGSGNGLTFTLGGSMSNMEFFNAIEAALQLYESGAGGSVSFGTF